LAEVRQGENSTQASFSDRASSGFKGPDIWYMKSTVSNGNQPPNLQISQNLLHGLPRERAHLCEIALGDRQIGRFQEPIHLGQYYQPSRNPGFGCPGHHVSEHCDRFLEMLDGEDREASAVSGIGDHLLEFRKWQMQHV